MKLLKILLTIVAIVLIAIGIGFFIPVSVSSTQGCENQNTPTIKLHLIKGESIEKAKIQKPKSTNCSDNPSYLLYIL